MHNNYFTFLENLPEVNLKTNMTAPGQWLLYNIPGQWLLYLDIGQWLLYNISGQWLLYLDIGQWLLYLKLI